MYQHYGKKLDALYARLPNLEKNFPRSIYPCATFNFGPQVRTFKHRDLLNCPFGWCSVTALGNFNPKQGGHLILWDPKLVIEFPPASTILIPSATLTHSNTPVGKGETRVSFTQYCSGGLFRWVDNGFRTEKQLKAESPDEYERMMGLKDTRWRDGISLLSTLDNILEHHGK